jgi:hypothetical protein
LNPSFEPNSIGRKVVKELLRTINKKESRVDEENEFIQIFQYFRDITIQSRMRFNHTLKKELNRLFNSGKIPHREIDTYHAQLYMCAAYTSMKKKDESHFVSVGFYALWKTVEYWKQYVNKDKSNIELTPSMNVYKDLIRRDYVPPDKEQLTTGMSVEAHLHSTIQSPLLLDWYDSLRDKISKMSSSIKEYVKRIFYM